MADLAKNILTFESAVAVGREDKIDFRHKLRARLERCLHEDLIDYDGI